MSGVRSPDASAASTIFSAMRSLVEPVGFWPSSLAHRRTPGFGDMRGMPTSGVLPIACEDVVVRVTQGVSQREGPRLAKRGDDPMRAYGTRNP